MNEAWKTFDDAIELKIVFANAVSAKFGLLNVILVSSTIVKVLASTFEERPPPVKYLTVKVVFEGAIP